MKILLDGRFYGLENAGLGRYTMNLIDSLSELDSKNSYILLLRKKYFDNLNVPKNWEKVEADFKHYGIDEQVKLPKLINKYNPDITHFLHFNVPINFKGKYLVTIHDMIMHRQSGRDATTLPYPVYLVKRLMYKKVFSTAVLNSQKIIVPSEFVKKEIVNYFKVPQEKVVVTYEGI